MPTVTPQPLVLAEFSLFLFDFDGLLVDTERLHFAAYQQLCRHYRLELPWNFEDFCTFAHRSSDHLRQGIFAAVPALEKTGEGWDQLYAHKKQLYHQLMASKGVALMQGVSEFLSFLQQHNKTCCVVTHSPRKDVDHIKSKHPILQNIPYWLTREDYHQPKPAPDGYLEAINRYLPLGGKAIGFEDSPRGIQSLRQTQAQPVFVTRMKYEFFGEDELKGVVRCHTLAELLPQEV